MIVFCVESVFWWIISYYFVYVIKYRFGFKIMKDVMWLRGWVDEGCG